MVIGLMSYNTMNLKKENEQLPLLLFFLENDKIAELVRLMFNRKVSEEYLLKYGERLEGPLGRSQQARLEDYVRRLQVQDIVHLKGSQRDQVKYYCNTFLEEFLSRKLKVCKFTSDDRKTAWIQLTEIFQLQNLYEGLSELELPPEIHSTIMKDIHRTYISPELHSTVPAAAREQLQKEMRQNLYEVLNRFSLYNPYIGYCQGMNTIVLFFLEEGFANQEVFFIFKKISEERLPCDYYSSMDSVITYVRILFEILHYTHPTVVKHMKRIMLSMEQEGFMMTMSFVFQWFICLFTNVNLNRGVRLMIMDYFLLEGVTVLFKAALGYFDVIEKTIATAKTFEQYIPLVEKCIHQFEDEQLMKRRLNDTYISGKILQLLKEKLMTKSGSRREKQEKTSCNHKWNTCLQFIENNVAEGNKHEFFVFRTKEEIRLEQNYLEKIQFKYFKMCKTIRKSDHLRVGRMVHVCRESSLSWKTQDEDGRSERKQSSSGYGGSGHKSIQTQPQRLSPLRVGNGEKGVETGRKEMIRSRAMQNLQSNCSSRKSVMNRSESVQFMRSMIENQSFSNLMEILQVNEMQNLFKDDISEDD